jgi:uncharacterized membrane protein YkvA (DUF1232 family)
MFARLKRWAEGVKRDVIALWIAARDPRTPLGAKLLAGATAAYALSPIDLIPDFIPVLGYLDDLVIVPLGIWLAVRLIPASLMEEFRGQADGLGKCPSSRAAAVAILILWAIMLGVLLWAYWPVPVR